MVRAILASLLIVGTLAAAPQPLQVDTQSKELIQTELNLKSVTLTLGSIVVSDAAGTRVFDLGSTNGTRIGDTGDKLAFWGAAPIVRPSGNVFTALVAMGAITSPSLTEANISGLSGSLSGKQPLDSDLTAISALATTAYGRGALIQADGTAFITYLGKTTLAGYGIVDGQPLDSDLTALAGVTTTAFGRDFNALADAAAARSKIGAVALSDFVLPSDTPDVATFFLTGYDATTGDFITAKPAFSDLTGTATAAQVPNLDAAKITTGAFDPARIPSLDAAKITTGTLDVARIPDLDATKITTGALNKLRQHATTAYTDTTSTWTMAQDFISHTTGSVTLRSLANPGAPTVGNTGVPGISTWSYRIVAKLGDGTETVGGTTGTTTTGNATLDTNNFNTLSWTAVSGAVTYDIYRTVAGLSPSTLGKITNTASTSYNDQGAAGNLAAVPTTNSTGGIQWLADNTSDIGGAATARPRDVNAGRNVNAVGGNFTTVASTTTTATTSVTGPIRDKGGQVFNVAAYATGSAGVPDDAFDDTAAVTAAISAAGANPVLFFAEGTWLLNDVQPPTGTKIIGAGRGVTILKKLSGASNGFVLRFQNTTSNVTVRDLTLDGNRGNISVTPLQFDFVLGIGGTHALVENVEIKHGESNGAFVGDTFIDATAATFRNCWIHSNGGTINATGYGTGILTGGAVLPSYLTIENCLIENNYNTVTQPNDSCGVNLTVAFGAKVLNNTFRNNYNVGGGQVTCNSGGTGSTYIGCIVTGNHVSRTGSFGGDSTNGIEIQSRGFTITDNIIDGFSTAGINPVVAAGSGTISQNTIRGGPTAIRLYGGGGDAISNVVITGNTTDTITTCLDVNTVNQNVIFNDNNCLAASIPWTVFGGNIGTLHATVTGSDNLSVHGKPSERLTATANVSLPGSLSDITVTFLDLPMGVWDVQPGFTFSKAATTGLIQTWAALSLTNNVLDLVAGQYAQSVHGFPGITMGGATGGPSGTLPVKRYIVTSTTQRVYLVARAQFDTSTMSVTGTLNAERARDF